MLKSPFAALAAATLLLSGSAGAQSTIEWIETEDVFGFQDIATSVATDTDGNVYIAGFADVSSELFESDWAIQKISRDGTPQWTATLDGEGLDDRAFAVLAGDPSEIYACGWIEDATFGRELALARFDSDGDERWRRTFRASDTPGEDIGFALCFDAAGNVVVTGRATLANARLDACAVAWSPAGDLLWSTLVDGSASGDDGAGRIVGAPTGELYFVAGFNSLLGNLGDAGLVKLAGDGQFLWKREVTGDDPTGIDRLQGLELAPNGDVLVCGNVTDVAQGVRLVTARYESDGDLVWMEFFGGGPPTGGTGVDVELGVDGVAWVGATVPVPGNQTGGIALRYGPGGALLSSETVQFAPDIWTNGLRLFAGNAGQALLTGFNFGTIPFELFVAHFDAEGDLTWKTAFLTPGSAGDAFSDATLTGNGRLVLASTQLPTNGSLLDRDLLTVQIDLNESPQAYCTAKTHSQGCAPFMTFAGLSSAADTSGFEIRTDAVLNQKLGLFAYSVTGSAAIPFGGGLLCVQGPIRRTPPQTSGGNQGTNDCSGRFALDWNAFATGQVGGTPDAALLVPGTAVFVQAWGRDPAMTPPNNIQLSNGLRYVVLP